MEKAEKKLVFSEKQILERVGRLAEIISRDYHGLDLVMIGVLNGGFIFFADLVRRLTISVRIDFVRLASYGGDSKSSGRIQMTKDVETNLKDRHALIIEDIADSGLTLAWLKNHLLEKGAASVKICVLIDKHERRDVPLDLDYVGFEVESGFLVGYGLDYDGQHRQLPEIYHLDFRSDQGGAS